MNKTHAERLAKFREKNKSIKVSISLDEIKIISSQIDLFFYGYKRDASVQLKKNNQCRLVAQRAPARGSREWRVVPLFHY